MLDLDTINDNEYTSNLSTEGLEKLLRQLSSTDIFRPEVPGEGHGNKVQREVKAAISSAKSAISNASDKGWMWWEVFKAVYSGRVRLNGWTGELTYDGKPTTEAHLIDQLEDILGMTMKLTKEQFDRKYGVWLGCGYNPVKEELERLGSTSTQMVWQWVETGELESEINELGQPTGKLIPVKEHTRKYLEVPPKRLKSQEWAKLATTLFGVPEDDNLSQKMLECWLVAAVARVMEPGCQADNTLVLKGSQGIGKSSFFRVLARDYYLGLSATVNPLEVLRNLNRSWIVEMGEIEGITRKKEVTELKDFLTQNEDVHRGLYKGKPEVHKRHCIFGGSANSSEILQDTTGSRRFWVIDCGSKDINIDYLKANRDTILATAYYLWENKYQYWLDKELTQQSEERNQDYKEVNSFSEPVARLVAALEKWHPSGVALKVSNLLTYGLQIPVERHKSNKNDKNVALALQELGYVKKKLTIDGEKTMYWVKPDSDTPKSPSGINIEEVLMRVHHNG